MTKYIAFFLPVLSLGCGAASVEIFECAVPLPRGFVLVREYDGGARYAWRDADLNHSVIFVHFREFQLPDHMNIEGRARRGRYEIIDASFEDEVHVRVIAAEHQHVMLFGSRAKEWGQMIVQSCP
jgi:hypothetical protein